MNKYLFPFLAIIGALLLFLIASFLYVYWEADAAWLGNHTGSPVWCGCFGCSIDPFYAALLYGIRALGYFLVALLVFRFDFKRTVILLFLLSVPLEFTGELLSVSNGSFFSSGMNLPLDFSDRTVYGTQVIASWMEYLIVGMLLLLAVRKVGRMLDKEV
jgi:hypothetical protein